MKLNFYIEDAIAVVKNGVRIDLHNNYDLSKAPFSLLPGTITLTWLRHQGEWVSDQLPAVVTLHFSGVLQLVVDRSTTREGFGTVDCIGFLHPSEPMTTQGFLEHRDDESWPMVFLFQNGTFVRVLAEYCTLEWTGLPCA